MSGIRIDEGTDHMDVVRRRVFFGWPYFGRLWFQIFWWRYSIGVYIILALIDSDRYVKLRKDDFERIKKAAGKPPDQMAEQELYAVMDQLNINEYELVPEDKVYIDTRLKIECPQCGIPLRDEENICENCGIHIIR